MIKLFVVALILNIRCSKPKIDPCSELKNKIQQEWKYQGKVSYSLGSSNYELHYFKDDLNLAELFRKSEYKECLVKYKEDSIIKMLGKPYKRFAYNYAYFLIEPPCLDPAKNDFNACNLSLLISFNENGYIKDIRRVKEERID